MATQVLDSKTTLHSTPSLLLPPDYHQGEYVELATLTPKSSTSTLPTYETAIAIPSSSASTPLQLASSGLNPTHTYQIEATGHPLIALPFASRPLAIDIFSVLPSGERGPLAYQSLRHARCSGNSVLTHASDSLAEAPLSSTTYRFGPGRAPRIQLLGAVAHDEEFHVQGKGLHTRSQIIRTHLGTFQWRYAGRKERKLMGAVNSLLVLEQITSVALAGGKSEERRRRVAQLVRSEELRSEGTTATTAGNGGRLVMDLGEWEGRKAEEMAMEVLVLTGCVVMLKKEVDRRRTAQAMVIAGAVGS